MKTNKKNLTSLLALPLLFSAASAFAGYETPNKNNWVATSDIEASILAKGVANSDSKGLVVNCYPGQNKLVINVHDLTGFRGETVRYWTDNNQGTFVTRTNGVISTAGNDPEILHKFVSDIAHDYSIVFQVGTKLATYSLIDSADTLRSLEGCGLPQPRQSER